MAKPSSSNRSGDAAAGRGQPAWSPEGLAGPLFADAAMEARFSLEAFVRRMVNVEVALATVESDAGVVPPQAAQTIAARAASFEVDYQRLILGTRADGVPAIELVRQLREHVGPEAADAVHFGATSQDVMDTALVLVIGEALADLEDVLRSVMANLADLARYHRGTWMAGRTHAQQAVPIPFGLKVAGWLAPLLRHVRRLGEIKPRLLVVQLGGAAGTLAPLGGRGLAIEQALAQALGLGVAPMPWHTQRDTLAEIAGWLSLVDGALAKMAGDIILLAQSEVGEVRESGPTGGGSSTMPQKHNPIVSEQIVAIARSSAGLVSAMHQALIQEHERGTHGWQIEWITLPRMFSLTAAAVRKAEFLTAHLSVDGDRMRRNLAASQGLTLAEAITYALASTLGRSEAADVVRAASRIAEAENRHLVDVVRERSQAPLDWERLKDETASAGSAQGFIDRVLEALSHQSDPI